MSETRARAIRRTVAREVQQAEAYLLSRVCDVVLERSLFGRLRWLFFGR